MSKKNIAIVLGGTSPHIALIKNLKNRGYYTVLVDYYENPPARKAADEHIRESTLDQEKVLEIATRLDAKLVISACVDQANVTACYVAEKLGLPAPYSYATALNVSNKGLMKKRMLENGIPTSKYIYVSNLSEFEDSDLEFPIVVKPADSSGSAGVKRANSLPELYDYLSDAIGISRTGKAIIEEFRDGLEVSVYSFVQDKKVHFLMIAERLSVNDGDEKVIKCYSTIAPARISQRVNDELKVIVNKIVNAFNLDNTPLHIQALIKDNDINIIEFAPRAGGGLSYKTIYLNTGFDIINSTVDSYLNVQVDLSYRVPEFYYSVNLIYARPGIFDYISGYKELMEAHVIEDLFSYKSKGMNISSEKASSSRVGAYIVKANTKNELFEKIRTVMNTLDVYDMDGNSIIQRDLYARQNSSLLQD